VTACSYLTHRSDCCRGCFRDDARAHTPAGARAGRGRFAKELVRRAGDNPSRGQKYDHRSMADESTGISRGGKEAEERFMAITGATPTARAALGDAVLDGTTVEIKHTKRTETLNQVRAVKYIPLVVWVSGEDAWYVIPAHRIVAIVSDRKRGPAHRESVRVCDAQSQASRRLPLGVGS